MVRNFSEFHWFIAVFLVLFFVKCYVEVSFFLKMFLCLKMTCLLMQFQNLLSAVSFSQDESVLARIRTDQRMARREGWMDNLAATLMGSRPMRKRSTTMTVREPFDQYCDSPVVFLYIFCRSLWEK